jgi:hypothetical protein
MASFYGHHIMCSVIVAPSTIVAACAQHTVLRCCILVFLNALHTPTGVFTTAAVAVAAVELAPVTDSVHHCSRMREGFYDVFYPDHSVLGKHLTKRKPAEYGSDDAPVCTYMYNPLQQNLWAIDYEDSDIKTIPEPFVGLLTDGKRECCCCYCYCC